MNYKIDGKTIILENGNQVEFDYNIKEAVHIKDVIVVALDLPPNIVMAENVFAVSSEGKMLWQIQPWGGIEKTTADYYVGVCVLPTNQIAAIAFAGVARILNLETGEIEECKITK